MRWAISISAIHCKYIAFKKHNFSLCFFPCTSSALLAFNYCPKYSGYMVFPMHIFAVCRNYTIEGRKLFKSRNYSRKCGDLTCTFMVKKYVLHSLIPKWPMEIHTPSLYYIHKSLSCHIAKKFLALLPEAQLICP